MPVKDMTGAVFGRLRVMSFVGVLADARAHWLCQCECGATHVTSGHSLRAGKTKSCGCLHRQQLAARNTATKRTHNMSKTPTYNTWASMRARCNDPADEHYADYGGRGISVCARWGKFENFFADMGEKPRGMSLGRINNGRGYSPKNCRWETPVQQARNRRVTLYVRVAGVKTLLLDACKAESISYHSVVWFRTRHAVSLQDAFDYYKTKGARNGRRDT